MRSILSPGRSHKQLPAIRSGNLKCSNLCRSLRKTNRYTDRFDRNFFAAVCVNRHNSVHAITFQIILTAFEFTCSVIDTVSILVKTIVYSINCFGCILHQASGLRIHITNPIFRVVYNDPLSCKFSALVKTSICTVCILDIIISQRCAVFEVIFSSMDCSPSVCSQISLASCIIIFIIILDPSSLIHFSTVLFCAGTLKEIIGIIYFCHTACHTSIREIISVRSPVILYIITALGKQEPAYKLTVDRNFLNSGFLLHTSGCIAKVVITVIGICSQFHPTVSPGSSCSVAAEIISVFSILLKTVSVYMPIFI